MSHPMVVKHLRVLRDAEVLLETDNPTTHVPATPEDEEWVRNSLGAIGSGNPRQRNRGGPSGAAYALLRYCGQKGGEHLRDGKWTHFDPPRDCAEFGPMV
jgi:hypothetical protein